jgi:hypothetical protein
LLCAATESLLKIIPPRPPEYARDREDFKIHTSPAFDALAPAESAAQHTLLFLFNAERAARLVEFHARNPENPGFYDVLEAVLAATWKSPHGSGYNEQIASTVDNVVLYDLMTLSANDHATDEVRGIASLKLRELHDWLATKPGGMAISDKAHIFFTRQRIELFEKDPKHMDLTAPVEPPDGPPIGSMGALDCDGEP